MANFSVFLLEIIYHFWVCVFRFTAVVWSAPGGKDDLNGYPFSILHTDHKTYFNAIPANAYKHVSKIDEQQVENATLVVPLVEYNEWHIDHCDIQHQISKSKVNNSLKISYIYLSGFQKIYHRLYNRNVSHFTKPSTLKSSVDTKSFAGVLSRIIMWKSNGCVYKFTLNLLCLQINLE